MLHDAKRMLVPFAVLAVLVPAAAPVLADAPLGYRRAADALVVKLTELPGEIDVSLGSPSLAIYGDGRAVVHRPAYMKNPGDHAFRLTVAELDALVASLAAKGVADFDADGARAAKRSALQARLAARSAGPVTVRTVFDAPTTIIELHLMTSSRAAAAVDRTISWYGVKADAEDHPGIPALQDLAAARAELLALMQRADGGAQ